MGDDERGGRRKRTNAQAMLCSSSSSDGNDDDDPEYRVDSSSDEPDYAAATPDDDNDAADVVLPLAAGAEGVVSSLLTQHDVDAVCKKYGVPNNQYTGRPAGDLRASSPPPPGAVCVYARALEAGMRVPLHPFFRDVLAHFGVAPTQIAPNGWRILSGFLVLCRLAGVPPSLAVFRYFFGFFPLPPLNTKHKGWYYFRSNKSGLCFSGLPHRNKDWRHGFFFLSSPEPWTCPVEWGEPSESSLMDPVLSAEDKKSAARLLRAHGGDPIDLRTCLCDRNLAAVMAPAPPSCTRASADSKGMDPFVYIMMQTIRAEKSAAASANKVKIEPGSDCCDSPLCGKERSLDEADGEQGRPSSVLPAAHGSSVSAGVCSPPRGLSRKRTRLRNEHDDDDRNDWEAARKLLQGAVAPLQHSAFARNELSDVVASCFVAILKAVNHATFCSGYVLELEKKLAARDAEIAALKEKLRRAKAELAAVKGRRRT